MEPEITASKHANVVCASGEQDQNKWRRPCGCLKTSEKLRQILKKFPNTTPPLPSSPPSTPIMYTDSVRAYQFSQQSPPSIFKHELATKCTEEHELITKHHQQRSASWQVVYELAQLVQMSVTATALAIYYLIFCYMQLIYYMLKSALYFHQADGPMKVTIGVVTLTSLIVGFNLLLRMEKLIHLS